MENTFNRLTAMLEAETGYSKDKISRKTSLNNDIRIDGDDAEELLSKYSIEFDVDMSRFEFYRYFNRESLDSFSIIKSMFGLGNKRKIVPITVEMLEKSALRHNWND